MSEEIVPIFDMPTHPPTHHSTFLNNNIKPSWKLMGYLEFFHLKIDYLSVEKNTGGGGGSGVIPNIGTISSLISEMG